jgi:hypothetical protein
VKKTSALKVRAGRKVWFQHHHYGWVQGTITAKAVRKGEPNILFHVFIEPQQLYAILPHPLIYLTNHKEPDK